MLAEIGHFALILALVFALLQVFLPSFAFISNNYLLSRLSKPLVWIHFFWILVSFLLLIYAFLIDDFSVKYVAHNSNTELPTMFKLSATWGAHEGSLLLWVLVLAIWSVAVSIFSKSLPKEILNHIIIILGIVSVGFLSLLLFTSNPFERLNIVPIQGVELNPLLQDFGLIVHPPLLYIGYVGMAVPFAFVLSALIRGKFDSTWLRWSRPWTLTAWAFLTLGITLGSWWAYYELGWGGWWFWDPVENASFMPWLTATALVHSLSVSEKRGAFKHWTVLLAIASFALSLLGAFLVRSGVLTSVHSFASNPTIGLFILIFLAIIVGGSLLLYVLRLKFMDSKNKFSLLSRESGLLINNIFLVAAFFVVFLGTLYPLLLEMLDIAKVSVGKPYFDIVFSSIVAPMFFIMAISIFFRWKQDNFARLFKKLKIIWIVNLLIFILGIYLLDNIFVLLALMIFCWITVHSLVLFIQRFTKGLINRSFLGMIVAHIGIAILVLGATVTSQFSEEKDIKMDINNSINLAGYNFTFKGAEEFSKENYGGHKGNIEVTRNQNQIILEPEKRYYSTAVMTEAAIDAGLFRDIYVVLGEQLENDAWSLRIHYKPFVRMIWLGGIFIIIGALLAVFDRRYRLKINHK